MLIQPSSYLSPSYLAPPYPKGRDSTLMSSILSGSPKVSLTNQQSTHFIDCKVFKMQHLTDLKGTMPKGIR